MRTNFKRKRSPLVAVGAIFLVIAIAVSIVSLTNHLSRGTSSLIEPQLEPTAFGGDVFLAYSFDEPLTDLVSNNNGAYSNNEITIVPKASDYSTDGELSFTLSPNDFYGTTDPYSVLGYDQRVYLTEGKVMMFDMDIAFTENCPYRIEFNVDLRYEYNYSTKVTGYDNKVVYSNGAFYRADGSKVSDFNGNSFHLTYIYLQRENKAFVYINGVYLTTLTNVHSDSVGVYVNGVNFHLVCNASDDNTPYTVSLDNYSFVTFEKDYVGPMSDLLKNPQKVKLQYCADSVLWIGGRPDAE